MKILNKYYAKYYYCDHCGFLQTEEPYWLNEAYARPINISDTSYMQRNIYLSKTLTTILSVFFNLNNTKFIDYAGGYGIFVRLMPCIGFDFYWHDKYGQNLFAKGFERDFSNKEKVEVVISFENFEHDSTHNSDHNKFSYMKTESMLFPLKNAPFMIINRQADKYTSRNNYKNELYLKRYSYELQIKY